MRALQRRAIAGGEAVTREFATCYEPFHASGTWPSCVENDRVVVEHWMHRDRPPRATIVALHGFTMGSAWIDAHVLLAARWFRLGFDVALLTLPFHGLRRPAASRYSGELFASWDVGRTNEAVRQAVYDVDLVRRWIAADSGRPVGVLGLSLGGYVAAVLASLYDDLAFVIPLVPPVTLDALASSLLAGTSSISLADLRAGYVVHCPLRHALAVPRERVLIVGARGDYIVPPEHAYALWRHWGEPPIHWYSGSHVAPFHRVRLVARIAAHLDALVPA
jgi:dienelactone hydrolase